MAIQKRQQAEHGTISGGEMCNFGALGATVSIEAWVLKLEIALLTMV